MDLPKTKQIRYCTNCDEISIINFQKLLSGESFKYLVYDYDGFGDLKVDNEKCYHLFEKIKDEFFEKADDQEAEAIIVLESEINWLENRFDIVFALLSTLISGNYLPEYEEKFINELKEWRYYLDSKLSLEQGLKKLTKQHQSSKTVINRKKTELKALSTGSSEKMSLIRQKIKLQRVLSMQIDLKKTSVTEWLEIIKESSEVVKSTRNGIKPDNGN